MSEPTNEQRAQLARVILQAYVFRKGEAFENSTTQISDLIADLLHLAERISDADEPAGHAVLVALMHYEAETMEGGAS